MKIALIALALTVSAPAFAGQTYNCREVKSGIGPATKSVLLTQIGNTPIEEGRAYQFNLKIADRGRVIVDERAVVTTEDVMFFFEVKGKRIAGTIYMDELDQSNLTIGNQSFRLDCK
jgi:hypothetical protein